MKITWASEHGVNVQATNPDERMKAYFRDQLRKAWLEEAEAFIEEVAVALRNSKPGEKIEVASKPIKVSIEREALMESAQREAGD